MLFYHIPFSLASPSHPRGDANPGPPQGSAGLQCCAGDLEGGGVGSPPLRLALFGAAHAPHRVVTTAEGHSPHFGP